LTKAVNYLIGDFIFTPCVSCLFFLAGSKVSLLKFDDLFGANRHQKSNSKKAKVLVYSTIKK
jgi:hypothetical protein